MSAAPAMPLFPDSYLADTTHLSTEEHGAYLLLLMAMWRRNGTVPNDDKDLARIVGLTQRKWLQIKVRLMPFLSIENGTLSQKRLQKEWEYVQEKRNKNAQNGALGGRPKSNEIKGVSKANGSVSDNPNETPSTQPQPLKKERLLVHSHPKRDFFPDFWLAYPRRDGPNPKKPAREVFLRLVAKGVDPQRLIDAAMALAREHPAPTRFIPQAKTWLSQERFDADEPVVTGDEFCPDEWPNTHFLKIRFRDERGHDPPPAIHGGRAGVFLPAEWVAASRQASNGISTTSQGSGIRGKGEEVSGIEGRQERGISDPRTDDTPSAVVGLDRLLSMERHVGFGRSDGGWAAHEQDGSEPIPIRLRS